MVTYTVNDGSGSPTATDTSTLTLAMAPVNDAPVDADESATVTEDVTLSVPAAAGLLANFTDADGPAAAVTSFLVAGNPTPFAVTPGTPGVATIAGVGVLTINSDGSYSFAPALDYAGAIPVVTYTVNDGSGSPTATDTSTLTLAMAPVNDAPVDADESATVTEDVTLSVPAAAGLLANFTDADGPAAAVTSFLVAGNPTPFAVTPGTPGVATIAGVGVLTINSDGSYSFAPALDYAGAIPVVTYTVNDGSGSPTATDTSTLTLAMAPVNDAPVDADESATVTEDVTLSVPAAAGLLANFTDADGPAAAVTSFLVAGNPTPFAVTPGTPGVATIAGVGVLTINSDGSYSFAPALDYAGAIPVVTYTVNDGSGSPTATDTSTLTLAMAPVNDAPVDADESATVTEDVTLSVPAAAGLLANFTDADGPAAAVTSFLVAGNPTPFAVTPGTPGVATIAGVGVLTINSDGSYSFAPALTTPAPSRWSPTPSTTAAARRRPPTPRPSRWPWRRSTTRRSTPTRAPR